MKKLASKLAKTEPSVADLAEKASSFVGSYGRVSLISNKDRVYVSCCESGVRRQWLQVTANMIPEDSEETPLSVAHQVFDRIQKGELSMSQAVQVKKEILG